MGGRIADIVVSPRDRSTWFVAVGSGGVWKTENAGITWAPIFEHQPSYSIGCVTLDPGNPDVHVPRPRSGRRFTVRTLPRYGEFDEAGTGTPLHLCGKSPYNMRTVNYRTENDDGNENRAFGYAAKY